MKEHQDSDTNGGKQLKKLGNSEKRETDSEDEGKVKSQKRVCPICKRTFLSGKAFGGHMSSAHVQAKGNKSKFCSKRPMQRKYNDKHAKYVADLIDEDDYSQRLDRKMGCNKRKFGIGWRCCYCDKDFPSERSLFGHMRCHPDRPYRGMDPPDCKYDINKNSGNGVSASAGKVDLVAMGWFAKGKTDLCSSSVPMVESTGNNGNYDEDDGFEENCMAVQLLMYLNTSGGPKFNLGDERVVEGEVSSATRKAFPLGNRGQSPNQQGAEAAPVSSHHLRHKGISKPILENGKDNSSDETDDELVNKLSYAEKGKGKIVEKKKNDPKYNNAEEMIIRKVKLTSSSARGASNHDLSPHSVSVPRPPTPPQLPHSTAENGKDFRCSHCGKMFTTHQALGGHKSSHNKFRMSIHNTIDDQVLPYAAAASVEDENGDIQKLICDESRSSKRTRSCKIRTKAVPAVKKLLDFDLNELPEEEF